MGRKAVCISNLKQTGYALLLYAADYDRWGPPIDCWTPGGEMWSCKLWDSGAGYLLPQFIGKKSPLTCPSCPSARGRFKHRTTVYGMHEIGYTTSTYNYWHSWRILSDPIRQDCTAAKADGKTFGHPWDFPYVMDSSNRFASAVPRGRQESRVGRHQTAVNSYACLRHLGNANILFADGHVESCDVNRLAELRFYHYVDYADGNYVDTELGVEWWP